ncbi:S-layer homology domain-containing protein [Brevibacillus sp. 179-C9.3 HS]|uniref:S-layer homology domain-containing protein n=1 Tax=unclassified Brevibacillus TaxID=2684853 RepID=UPI00399FC7BA
MVKRFAAVFLMALLVVQSVYSGSANAAAPGMFTDIQEHWAREHINEMADLGIVKRKGYQPFYPNKPVTRGEALAMLNRVFETVYGPIEKPERKANLDHRYLLRGEVDQLLSNLKTLMRIETDDLSKFDPGDRMLYYLYLAENGHLMKKQAKENPEWWMSSAGMQWPLSREEASLVLLHMLAPQKYRTANIKPQDAASYFNSYYEWKRDRFYRDTYSPYALGIREFNLFLTDKTFSPDKIMTRAEYVVVMKRLIDYYRVDTAAQFRGSPANQQHIAQVYLRAANLAYETKNQKHLSAIFTEDALKSMTKLAQVPKYNGPVKITVKADENNSKAIWVIAHYLDPKNGDFQIEYKLEEDASNIFGRKITTLIYSQK